MGNLTAEEIVKITLGIIGISFLIYLSVSLIGIFTYKTASEQAKATLDELTNAANSLTEGQTKSFLIVSPQKWVIMAFEQNSKKEICFCPKVDSAYTSTDAREEQIKLCLQNKVCETINLSFGEKSICDFSAKTGSISPKVEDCLSLNTLPKSILLSKKADQVLISVRGTVDENSLSSISAEYLTSEGKQTATFNLDFVAEIPSKKRTYIDLSPLVEIKSDTEALPDLYVIQNTKENRVDLVLEYYQITTSPSADVTTLSNPSLTTIRDTPKVGYISLEDGYLYVNKVFEESNYITYDSKTLILSNLEKGYAKSNLVFSIESLKKIN